MLLIKKKKMLQSIAPSKTPIIRKHLQTIRKLWNNSSPQEPFFFTHNLDDKLTIELFCVQFVMQKYMQT